MAELTLEPLERLDLRRCTNNSVSVVSAPLCRDPWNGVNCPSLGYMQTGAPDAASCDAFDGRACEGYARQGDLPAEVSGKLQGRFMGCMMTAF